MSASQQYDDTNKGALFVNDKQGNPKRPDWRGKVNVNGVEFWISGWNHSSREGAKYIQLAIQPKQAQDHPGAPRNPTPRQNARRSGPPPTERPAQRKDPPPKTPPAQSSANNDWNDPPF